MLKRKKNGLWEEEMMERALAAYRDGDMGLNEATRNTMSRKLLRLKQHFGLCAELPKEMEDVLVFPSTRPEIFLRQNEATSMVRTNVFSRDQVKRFFKMF
ncbi:hypothetical protein PR048_010819 [Dryococelus australis]|uniref:Uncharacterized protein n=1 Tax=Dryococelus australis TaxID=614101 RepID=A0ABQ9I3S6_9NEOP|nr:hypothetical protein PR048_010819 [Dryococelus australis]